MVYHNPVLLKESINWLINDINGTYVDVTFGGGGHSKEILNRLDNGRLIAFDQDEEALRNKINDDRFLIFNVNFRFIKQYLKLHKISAIDGLIADLGVSSYQIDNPERGFSTRYDGELDGRMSKKTELTASKILNNYSTEKLIKIFRFYGELERPDKIAYAIESFRNNKSIKTLADLKLAVQNCIPKQQENKFMAKLLQSLRIEVNEELDALKEMLVQAADLLKKGGRIVVISYHSLEDRLVKNFFKTGNFEGETKKDFFGNCLRPLEPLVSKPILPSEEEIALNNRARSAKMRVAEKI